MTLCNPERPAVQINNGLSMLLSQVVVTNDPHILMAPPDRHDQTGDFNECTGLKRVKFHAG